MRDELESGRNVSSQQVIEISKCAVPLKLLSLQSFTPSTPTLVPFLQNLKQTIKASFGNELDVYCLMEWQSYETLINNSTKGIATSNPNLAEERDKKITKAIKARFQWMSLYQTLEEQKYRKSLEDNQIKRFFTINDLLASSIQENKQPEKSMIFPAGPFNIYERKSRFEESGNQSKISFSYFIERNIEQILTLLQSPQADRKLTYAYIQYLLKYLSVRDDSSFMLARTFCLEESYWYFERLNYGKQNKRVYLWEKDNQQEKKVQITLTQQSFWLSMARQFNPTFSISNEVLPFWQPFEENKKEFISLNDFDSNIAFAYESGRNIYKHLPYQESLPLMGLLRNLELVQKDTSQEYAIIFCKTMIQNYIEAIKAASTIKKKDKDRAITFRCDHWKQAIELLQEDQRNRSRF